MVKHKNAVVAQVLIRWSNTPSTDSTREDSGTIRQRFPNFSPCGQGHSQGEGNVANWEEQENTNTTAGKKALKFDLGWGRTTKNRPLFLAKLRTTTFEEREWVRAERFLNSFYFSIYFLFKLGRK